jgi:hypothetical protein
MWRTNCFCVVRALMTGMAISFQIGW